MAKHKIQHGKDKKRKKEFHKGKDADRRLRQGLAIFKHLEPNPEVDYTLSKPVPLRRNGKDTKGDALS